MTRIFAACLVAAAALIAVPQAAADPADLVPYCSAGQTPMDNNCRPMTDQPFTNNAPGANPDVPLGTNPGSEPVVGG
jgi:hypothetical protein